MRGLGVVSWMIVFIFISLSFLTAILLYVFGLDPSSGSLKRYDVTPDKRDIRRQIKRELREENRYRRKVRGMEENPRASKEWKVYLKQNK